MPQNMDNNTITDYKKKIKLLTILLVSSLLAILILIGLFAYQSKFSKPAESFEITNVNKEVLKELENSIVFAGAEKKEQQLFYSPTLQIKFNYDSNIFDIYDLSPEKSLSISPKNLQSNGYLRILDKGDVKDYYLKEYSNVDGYEGFTLEEEKEESGIKYLLFKYQKSSQLDKTKKKDVYMSVLARVLDNSTIAHLEIREFDYRKSNLTPSYLNVLTTISTDTSSINKEGKSIIGSGLVTVSYDLNIWQPGFQGDNLTSISLIDGNAELRASIESVYVPKYTGDISSAILKERLGWKDASTTYKDVKILYENKDRKIGGMTFKEASYETTYSLQDSPHISFIAVIFLPNTEEAVIIETEYDSDKPKALEEIIKVYDNIVIQDKEIFSSLQPSTNDNVLGSNSVVLNSATILAQASTVRLFVEDCIKATFAEALRPEDKLPLTGKTYDICSASAGTGFAVDSNGHFVTNAHVVNEHMTDTFILSAFFNESYLRDFLATVKILIPDAMSYVKSEDDLIKRMVSVNMYFKEEDFVRLSKGKTTIYIQGSEPFEIDENTGKLLNSDKHIEAQIVEAYEMDSEAEAVYNDKDYIVTKPDLALIRISENYHYPNLVATSVDSIPGEGVFVIGYPGISDNKHIFGSSSKVNSTVTGGVISALRDSSMNNYKLLQIDASVDHGNSGGPIINSAGDFIGVATYGLGAADGGNYNAGVYYSSVLELLSKNGVINSTNLERATLASALKHIENSYYQLALKDLNEVKSVNANIPNVIDPLIALSESKIAEGQDQTPWIVTDFLILPNWALLLIIGLFLVLVVTIILIVMFAKKRKTEQVQQPTTPQTINVPLETVQPQANTGQIQQPTVQQPTNAPTNIEQQQAIPQPQVTEQIQQPTTPQPTDTTPPQTI